MYTQLLANIAILVLSGFVGFAVISKVPNTLHTPLMSGTNAIHGIVVLGALLVLGNLPADAHWGVRIIAFVALVFGTLNVIGGVLVTAAAVESMKPGSVVVDLAGETGGNCELTEPGKTVVKHGVTIASPLNLPATMPEHASELYSKNLTSLLELLIKDGALAPDFSDEVLAASCVTREVRN